MKAVTSSLYDIKNNFVFEEDVQLRKYIKVIGHSEGNLYKLISMNRSVFLLTYSRKYHVLSLFLVKIDSSDPRELNFNIDSAYFIHHLEPEISLKVEFLEVNNHIDRFLMVNLYDGKTYFHAVQIDFINRITTGKNTTGPAVIFSNRMVEYNLEGVKVYE